MPVSASLVWMGEVALCWTGGGFESSWCLPGTCQFSRQVKLKKQIYLEALQFPPLLAAVVVSPSQNLMGTLNGSNMGGAYQRKKVWSGPEHFCQLSSRQKSGKFTEVESTEKYTTLCVLVPWMAHCTGLKCESTA